MYEQKNWIIFIFPIRFSHRFLRGGSAAWMRACIYRYTHVKSTLCDDYHCYRRDVKRIPRTHTNTIQCSSAEVAASAAAGSSVYVPNLAIWIVSGARSERCIYIARTLCTIEMNITRENHTQSWKKLIHARKREWTTAERVKKKHETMCGNWRTNELSRDWSTWIKN